MNYRGAWDKDWAGEELGEHRKEGLVHSIRRVKKRGKKAHAGKKFTIPTKRAG